MDDSCAVCAETLDWVAYGPCGHREVCSTCVIRLRFILNDRRCCICKTENPLVFLTKAMGDYTRVVADFSVFPESATEGRVGEFWHIEDTQAYFDDEDHYKMIRSMCRLSCNVCTKSAEEQGIENSKRRGFKDIEQLKRHLYHQHTLFMCNLCLEGKKVFVCEQKLYTKSQLKKHIRSGNSAVDGDENERGGFTGHPMCEFCKQPFYGDGELYTHRSTEHYTCHICRRQNPARHDYHRNYDDLEMHFRQQHFLCENEACLAQKFIVFQSEYEMKRHNISVHGGHMSRSKKNVALQTPGYRYGEHHQGRSSIVLQERTGTTIEESKCHNCCVTYPPTEHGDTSNNLVRCSAKSSTIWPEKPSRVTDDQNSRIAPILHESTIRNGANQDLPAHCSTQTLAQTVRGSTRFSQCGNTTLSNSASCRPSECHKSGFSTSQVISSQGSTSSTSSSSCAGLTTMPTKGDGFASPESVNSARDLNNVVNIMSHATSAPNLAEKLSKQSTSMDSATDVQAANKFLVEKIRIGLGMNEAKFGAFRSISQAYYHSLISSWEYLSNVEQFGLSHLVPELALLCPSPQKKEELIHACSIVGSSKASTNQKGKEKVIENAENSNEHEALTDRISDIVRELQLGKRPLDGNRSAKDNLQSSVGGTRKDRRKAAKLRTARFGDGSLARLIDLCNTKEKEREATEDMLFDGLPLQGAWKNGGGRKLFKK